MSINYYSKNYEIGDEVKGYIEEKIEKYNKYSTDGEVKANIKIEKTKHQNHEDAFNMTLEIILNGRNYFADKDAVSVFQVIDECDGALNEIIRREKDKNLSDKKRSESTNKIELETEY